MNDRNVSTFSDDRAHMYEYTYIWTIFSRTFLGACLVREDVGEEGGQARKGRPDRDGDFETCVMAFLVLSCIRTLTLLAYIRAWSWLPSAFLSSSNHTYPHYMCSPFFARLWDGTGAYRTRISSRTNATATILQVCISANLIYNLSFTFYTIFVKDLEDLNRYDFPIFTMR